MTATTVMDSAARSDVRRRPVIDGATRRTPRQCSLRLADGGRLFYRAWLPEGRMKGAVVLLHRGHEHSGYWQDLVDEIELDGYGFFAWDMRGHGRTVDTAAPAGSTGHLVRDLDEFVAGIAVEYAIGLEDIALVGHSMGGVLAAAWVHDYAPPVRALVLGSPAFRVRLYVPFAMSILRWIGKVRPDAEVSSYVKGRLLTRDSRRRALYDTDPLVKRRIPVRLLVDLYDTATRLIRDASAISTPVLLLSSGADWVVRRSAQKAFFRGLISTRKTMRVYPGFLHDVFGEKSREIPIAEARSFILDSFSGAAEGAESPLRPRNDPRYLALMKPLPRFSARWLRFKTAEFLLKTVGRLSEGIRLGWREGFDSGAMLDYVYRDRASGFTPLGRIIDRTYLDSPGWRGIRVRRQNLEATISRAMRQLAEEERPVHLLDIATGHGRYVLNAMGELPETRPSALLRDWSADNIECVRALAGERGIPNVRCETGDAFDRHTLGAIRPRPTLAIVSGLYELYPDNGAVRASLAGLADAVEPGGYLIYSNQPWHPQQELIGRVLTSHRAGRPWVMRCRSQAEMDGLVREAGFEKIATDLDEMGIFSVSLARRR